MVSNIMEYCCWFIVIDTLSDIIITDITYFHAGDLSVNNYVKKMSVKLMSVNNRVRYYRGRVSNCDQSEARKQCFLDSDWSKFETLPRKFRTL